MVAEFLEALAWFIVRLLTRRQVPYCLAVRENVMKIVPVVKSGDLERSLHFYTEVLDFERKWPGYEDREIAKSVIDLVRDGAELQLFTLFRRRCPRFDQPCVCGRR